VRERPAKRHTGLRGTLDRHGLPGRLMPAVEREKLSEKFLRCPKRGLTWHRGGAVRPSRSRYTGRIHTHIRSLPKDTPEGSSRCLLPTLTMIVWGFWPLQSHFLQTPLWQTPLGTFIERLFAYWCARRTRTNPKGLCRRSDCCGLLDGQMAKVELYEGG
jgi:hypothetical protein